MLAMLRLIVDSPPSSAELLWSQIVLVVAILVFFVAFVLLLGRKAWPKASPHAPTFVALGFVALAIALLLAAL
jgi:hypothetical protein